jgi:hypothetical protein
MEEATTLKGKDRPGREPQYSSFGTAHIAGEPHIFRGQHGCNCYVGALLWDLLPGPSSVML